MMMSLGLCVLQDVPRVPDEAGDEVTVVCAQNDLDALWAAFKAAPEGSPEKRKARQRWRHAVAREFERRRAAA